MTKEGIVAAGEALKLARLKKGDSLEEASRRTRISKKYLAALEGGRPDDFPAPVYLDGFFRSYCDYLGVTLDPLEGTASKTAPAPRKEPAHWSSSAAHPEAVGNYKALMTLSVLILCVSGVWLWREASVLNRAPAPAQAAPAAAADAESAQTPSAYRENLTIIFHENVRLRVFVDGKEEFKGAAARGVMQEWRARKAITLETGNPRAFDLMLNGTPYSLAPSASGQYVIRVKDRSR